MELDEFFEKLPRNGWRLDECSAIRRIDDLTCCPMLSIAKHREFGPYQKTTVGLSWRPIWQAADNAPGHNKRLRTRLLAHCGLKES